MIQLKNLQQKEIVRYKKRHKTQGKNSKMADLKQTLSVITLNINGLNRIKNRNWHQCLWDPTTCCLQVIHFRFKDKKYIEKKRTEEDIPWKYKSKEDYHSCTNIRQNRLVKIRIVTRIKAHLLILIEESVYQVGNYKNACAYIYVCI